VTDKTGTQPKFFTKYFYFSRIILSYIAEPVVDGNVLVWHVYLEAPKYLSCKN